MKKSLVVLIAVLLMAGSLSVTAAAENRDETVTITLKAGTGSGEEIVLKSDVQDMLAEDWDHAEPGLFYQAEESMFFRLPEKPESFEAPEGMIFAGWTLSAADDPGEEPPAETGLNAPGFWIRTETETVLTAEWKEKRESQDLLKEVKLSLEAPECGTEVKTEKNKTGQEPVPEILIPSDARYEVISRWVLPPFGEENLFSGTVEGAHCYYAELVLTGTGFADDVRIRLTGGELYAFQVVEGNGEDNQLIILIMAEAKHIPGEIFRKNETEASCSEEGSYDEVRICTACGEELSRKTVKVDKLAHTPGEKTEENRIEATCAEAGSYDEVVACTVCGEEISRETIVLAKPDHTPAETVVENEKEASCAEEGGYDEVIRCSVCGEELNRKTIRSPKTEHVPAEPVREKEKDADCGEEGSYDEVVYCAACHEELSRKTVKTPKKEHDWAEASYDWSADFSSVTAKRVCRNDPKHVETEKVPTSCVEEKATCLKGGVMTYTASFQNPAFALQTRQKVTTAATGHKWGEWKTLTAATTTSEGLEARVCENDATHTETRIIPKKTPAPSGGGSGSSSSVQHVHTWKEPTFSWKADFSGATATFVCKSNKNHTQRAEATVKSELILPEGNTDGKTVFTATVIFEGKSWTDTKEMAIRSAGADGYSCGSFSGSWIKGTGEGIEIRVSRRENGDLAEKLFRGITIDERELQSLEYSVEKNMTIRIPASVLESLEQGPHTIRIVFADGSTETSLNVTAKETKETKEPGPSEQREPEETNEKPEEPEHSGLFWWIVVPVTAGAAFAAVLLLARRKRKKN